MNFWRLSVDKSERWKLQRDSAIKGVVKAHTYMNHVYYWRKSF